MDAFTTGDTEANVRVIQAHAQLQSCWGGDVKHHLLRSAKVLLLHFPATFFLAEATVAKLRDRPKEESRAAGNRRRPAAHDRVAILFPCVAEVADQSLHGCLVKGQRQKGQPGTSPSVYPRRWPTPRACSSGEGGPTKIEAKRPLTTGVA
ncbi:hypothetical protein MRX96_005359 [Rhipicephalus microplus]